MNFYNTITALGWCLLLSLTTHGQDMQQGFALLDSGQFGEASQFFEEVLLTYPDNKTAKLCYGRAIGLSDNPQLAIQTFKQLDQRYPNDLEVLLNLAESYLWAKDFTSAVEAYRDLKVSFPDHQGISLGLANSLSSNQEHLAAKREIERALNMGDNPQVNTSHKYIMLAYAHSIKNEYPAKSVQVLKALYKTNRYDKDILIALGYNALTIKDYELSQKCFELLSRDAPVDSQLGLATLYLTTKRPSKSEKILNQVKPTMSSNDTRLGQLEVLLYDIYLTKQRLSKANSQLGNIKKYLSKEQYLEKVIYLKLAQDNKEESADSIKLVSGQTTSNALSMRHAMEFAEYEIAETQYNQYSSRWSNEQLLTLMHKYQKLNTTPLTTEFSYLNDNNGNVANQFSIKIYGKPTNKLIPSLCYMQRWVNNDIMTMPASNMEMLGGLGLRWNHRHMSSYHFGTQSSSLASKNNYIYKAFHTYNVNKKQYFKGIFEKSVLDYNSSLLATNIIERTYGLEHHIYDGFRLGSFTQVFYKRLTGDNQGIVAFNSIYYSMLSTVTWQIGLNTNYLSFNDMRLEYFSPESLTSLSLFTKLTNEYVEDESLKYIINLGIGKQFATTENLPQTIYSIHAQIGYIVSPSFDLACYYKYSNSSNVANNGYSAYQLGLIGNGYFGYKNKL